MPRIEKVTFLGYADAKEADDPFKAAFEIARLCAQKGYTIVNGGGPGVMKASTLGAKSAGGKAIGITFFPKDIPMFEGRDETNTVDELIVVDNYLERTLKLLQIGHVFIIFNGGTGTISEFGMAWGLARLYFGHHKPLILYGDFWQEIIFAFTRGMYIRPEERQVFKIINKPQDALVAIEEFQTKIDQLAHNHQSPGFSI
ncbi:hypothetical protein A3D81_01625 [Candidatus Curtissbacteria bacterium RIFCSPHIGHO2_02_FULL_40_17]|uniref:Uncharacterized protein n=4 Tax=Candidatus Curtissiibacteriota TaxID=1752717 RepID=A0A1F5GH71_9BACT|nr:MAG: hypothetical protein A2693_03385 [Candidatus Curtissbacteria bacterium RIFCSPHIGHO2_01_FULL_40_12]OGD91157.1 MAG: hypothetical protein A3D81_01625 [Candidatus Curtissbacteria bacterium RIFCSPHIGHO2_02_FULL_40_17]OGE05461.1 MAG: hypothetical protein A3F45_03720 [Candidatus Curtissbacteria bacterium RIFCSPHIGHO2_12_FULL_41_17]OGE07137.1 MAG: hypothetical protein A3I53_02980 [Candidatus Curtissbacteria bacterium RIFCSPLOWO2_02_FULL_40_13b]